jgi:hypothetical protein
MMITNEHPRARVIMDPSEIKGKILPETVRLDNDAAVGDMLITDKALADEVRDGKRDLSPGYFADIIEESGIFNDEPYEAVQKKVLYDHLAVVKKGRCARPVCGILDSIDPDPETELMEEIPDIPDIPKSALTDSIEKDLGKLHQVAAGLSEKNRELVGSFVESINSLLLIIHRMNGILNGLPEDKRNAMRRMVKSVTKSMAAISDTAGDEAVQSPPRSTNDSHSSVIDEDKKKETQETMAESIVVDGVEYTPEIVKKLVVDSAALSEVQKKTTETKELLDAKEAKLVETDTSLKTSEAKAAALQAQIDAIEQERRAPLIKQIVDAMPALKEEDLKTWDMKRLTDTAASIPEADKLRMKAGAKPSKSIVDDAYAKVSEK